MELFVKLDERLLRDDKIRALIKARGYEGLGVYLALLTLIRNYKDHAYQIPLTAIQDIAEWDLRYPLEKLQDIIDICVDLGLFKRDEKSFWSERRKQTILKSEEATAKMSEAGKKGIYKRWGKEL